MFTVVHIRKWYELHKRRFVRTRVFRLLLANVLLICAMSPGTYVDGGSQPRCPSETVLHIPRVFDSPLSERMSF
jgi:hypothetical protein